MTVKHRFPLLVMLLVLATLGVPAVAAALPLNDSLPPLSPSPVTIPLAEGASAIYKVSMIAGESVVLGLSPASGAPATLDFDLYLFGPSATDSDHNAALAKSTQPVAGHADAIIFQAPSSGTYYVEVYAFDGTGSGVLTWSVLPEPLLPVYRFYNVRTGTHFYTPDEAERINVMNTMGNVFAFEGVAYYTKATKNTQYLYRFYNMRTGTHFYTADEAERERVITTLGYLYSFDGPTFRVSPTSDGGKAPVYRFYNTRTGSHFYTADEAERLRVQNTLGYMYTFEGPAFYLGQ